MLHPLLSCLTSLLLCLSLPATSDTTAEKEELDWYQIELLIFRHKGQSDDELWPEEIEFNYPTSITGLRDAGVLYKSDLEALLSGEVVPKLPDTDSSVIAGLEATPAEPDAEADVEPEPEQAFVRLPPEARLLQEDRLRLGRSASHELLFYEAWRQPLIYQPDADHLLISAGEKFGEHSVLEGYVSLSRTRFIHLDINLLVNTFAETGLSQPQSITLPDVPIVMEPATSDDLQLFDISELPRRRSSGNEDIEDWGPEATPVTVALDESGLPVVLDEDGNALFETDPNSESDADYAEFVAVEVKNIRHQRRLRSRELHYLDHPSIGVLFFATPWEPEAPEALDNQ